MSELWRLATIGASGYPQWLRPQSRVSRGLGGRMKRPRASDVTGRRSSESVDCISTSIMTIHLEAGARSPLAARHLRTTRWVTCCR